MCMYICKAKTRACFVLIEQFVPSKWIQTKSRFRAGEVNNKWLRTMQYTKNVLYVQEWDSHWRIVNTGMIPKKPPVHHQIYGIFILAQSYWANITRLSANHCQRGLPCLRGILLVSIRQTQTEPTMLSHHFLSICIHLLLFVDPA